MSALDMFLITYVFPTSINVIYFLFDYIKNPLDYKSNNIKIILTVVSIPIVNIFIFLLLLIGGIINVTSFRRD